MIIPFKEEDAYFIFFLTRRKSLFELFDKGEVLTGQTPGKRELRPFPAKHPRRIKACPLITTLLQLTGGGGSQLTALEVSLFRPFVFVPSLSTPLRLPSFTPK
ncbi:hypothetical protein NPIL_68281 [Nephila pilipes]|uniref:Uncharacterized protein n=1 Tax=Nephila pilipes TaxID=299642 RepID=A0A8X6UJ91_NEPPI|nr:hypothetical protein NPIL_68281 [Nephila pilipes]